MAANVGMVHIDLWLVSSHGPPGGPTGGQQAKRLEASWIYRFTLNFARKRPELSTQKAA